MLGKKILTQLSPYKQGMQTHEVKEKYGLDKIVKLASNENPYVYSPSLKEHFERLTHSLEVYPDGYAGRVRTKLANTLNINEEKIVFGHGSEELIALITRAYLEAGDRTIMAESTFSLYKHHSLIEGAEVVEVPTVNGYHNLDAMQNAVTNETKLIWICAPDNPTGTLLDFSDIEFFLDELREDIVVVLDEAYYEYVEKSKRYDSLELIHKYSNLIILRTFSKAYGLAALRLGYGLMNEALAEHLNVIRGAFNTTSLSQELASIALEDQTFIENTYLENLKVKNELIDFLEKEKIDYYPSEANFLLIKVNQSGFIISEKLLKQGFIIRPGELLGYPETIRVTLGRQEDMREFMQALLNSLQ